MAVFILLSRREGVLSSEAQELLEASTGEVLPKGRGLAQEEVGEAWQGLRQVNAFASRSSCEMDSKAQRHKETAANSLRCSLRLAPWTDARRVRLLDLGSWQNQGSIGVTCTCAAI